MYTCVYIYIYILYLIYIYIYICTHSYYYYYHHHYRYYHSYHSLYRTKELWQLSHEAGHPVAGEAVRLLLDPSYDQGKGKCS